jgi:hypothetical protein
MELSAPDLAVEPSSVGSHQDFPIMIAAKPISTRDRNVALAAIVVLAIIDAIVIPFASVHLPVLTLSFLYFKPLCVRSSF